MPFKNCSLYAGVNFEDLNRKQNTFCWGAALSFSDSWKDVTATKLTTTHFLCSGELSVCKSGL